MCSVAGMSCISLLIYPMKQLLKYLAISVSFVMNEPSDSINDGTEFGVPKLLTIILYVIYLCFIV